MSDARTSYKIIRSGQKGYAVEWNRRENINTYQILFGKLFPINVCVHSKWRSGSIYHQWSSKNKQQKKDWKPPLKCNLWKNYLGKSNLNIILQPSSSKVLKFFSSTGGCRPEFTEGRYTGNKQGKAELMEQEELITSLYADPRSEVTVSLRWEHHTRKLLICTVWDLFSISIF